MGNRGDWLYWAPDRETRHSDYYRRTARNIALTKMFFGEHALEGGAFRGQLPQVWRVKPAAEDLLKVLVLFDHDNDVVIHRQRRRPGRPISGHRGAGGAQCDSNNDAKFGSFRHLPSAWWISATALAGGESIQRALEAHPSFDGTGSAMPVLSLRSSSVGGVDARK